MLLLSPPGGPEARSPVEEQLIRSSFPAVHVCIAGPSSVFSWTAQCRSLLNWLIVCSPSTRAATEITAAVVRLCGLEAGSFFPLHSSRWAAVFLLHFVVWLRIISQG